MPTSEPIITTDRLIAAVRKGMTTEPLLTEKARPVADHLAGVMRARLPHIAPADTGEAMIHLALALSVAMTVLSEKGETPNSAILIATSAAAIAGIELYETEGTRAGAAGLNRPPAQPAEKTEGDDSEAADAAARLRAWFKAEGPLVMDEEDLDDVQKVLAAYERGVTAQPNAESEELGGDD